MNRNLEKYGSSLIREMNAMAGPDSINLTLGQINLSPSQEVRESVAKAAEDGQKYRYTPSTGLEELRQEVADKHNKKYETTYSLNNVLVTAGVSPGLESALKATLGEEKQKVLAPEIGYPTYWIVPEMLGFEVEKYKLDQNLNPDLNDLEDKIGRDTILILNSPSNPTGSVFPRENIEAISNLVNERKGLVVSDEVYDEIYFGEKPSSISKYAPERTMVLNSLSKSGLMPGMRIGWVIAQENLLENISRAHQYTNSCVNSLAQVAAIAHFQRDENRTLEKIKKNRKELVSNLAEAGVRIKPQGGIYGWINTEEYGNSGEVSERLLNDYNVVTVPGKAFGEKGDSYVRVSFGGKTSDVKTGAKKLGKFLKNEREKSRKK